MTKAQVSLATFSLTPLPHSNGNQAHGYGGGPLLSYDPPPGHRGQAYRQQYGQMQQYGGPPGYGYGGGFTQNSQLLGPGWEDYDPRKHNWKQSGPEDQFC